MARISKLLNDSVVSSAELALKKLGKYGVVAGRLQIIVAAKNMVSLMYAESMVSAVQR